MARFEGSKTIQDHPVRGLGLVTTGSPGSLKSSKSTLNTFRGRPGAVSSSYQNLPMAFSFPLLKVDMSVMNLEDLVLKLHRTHDTQRSSIDMKVMKVYKINSNSSGQKPSSLYSLSVVLHSCQCHPLLTMIAVAAVTRCETCRHFPRLSNEIHPLGASVCFSFDGRHESAPFCATVHSFHQIPIPVGVWSCSLRRSGVHLRLEARFRLARTWTRSRAKCVPRKQLCWQSAVNPESCHRHLLPFPQKN